MSIKRPGETQEPISWLQLERYHLGELDAETSEQIARSVEASAPDRACSVQIEREQAAPLPALRLPERRPIAGRWLLPLSLAAAAAGLLIFFLPGDLTNEPVVPGLMPGLKGGSVAVVLVRQRGGVSSEDPTTFAPGDRFKLSVTCGFARPVHWDLMVIHAEQVAFPLEPIDPVPCGNRVSLPGAFEIDANEPVRVCAVVGEQPWDRVVKRHKGRPVVPAGAICKVLWPVELP